LNDNKILHVPKFQFGFEALCHFCLNNNKIEMAEDIASLADLEQLQDVSIIDNPIVVHSRSLSSARATFAGANINLRTHESPPAFKSCIVGPLKKVRFDPLTLPAFIPAHIHALNQRIRRQMVTHCSSSLPALTFPVTKDRKPQPPSPPLKPATEDEIFMTSFESKPGEESDITIPEIEPEPIPEPGAITSVWNDVPVLQLTQRVCLSPQQRPDFVNTFRKLEFLVAHPEVRLRPREATSMIPDETEELVEQPPDLMIGKEPVIPWKPSSIATKLFARTEYTKAEIQAMVQSMEERLSIVERDLQLADETGQSAVDMALDQKNFATLHKQYETIRAELINTLNS
jgi:hypothetical protein